MADESQAPSKRRLLIIMDRSSMMVVVALCDVLGTQS